MISSHFPTRVKQYKLISLIYSSPNSVIYSSIDPQTSQKLILKLINKNRIPSKQYDTETKISMTISHPYLLRALKFFDISDFRVLLFPRVMHGDLQSWIRSGKVNSIEIAAKIMFRLVCAVSYLHSQKILHGDIKSQNVLMLSTSTDDPHPSLIDYGFSTFLNHDEYCHCTLATVNHAAPELLAFQPHSFPSDIWSLGITFYNIIRGRTPYPNVESALLQSLILTKQISFYGGLFQMSPPSLATMIKKMLSIDPENRPTASELLNDPFFLDILDHSFIHSEIEDTLLQDSKFSRF